jgi:O-antigen/teichoic acid export membrane protein
MISAMRGDIALGWYNAAYQIVLALEPAASVFMAALIPVISRLFVSSDQMLQFTYSKSIEYLAILGIPTAVGCTVLAGRIIPLLYGAGFDNSIIAFQILIWIFLLACINRPMLYTLGATNRQGTMAIIVIMATLLNIGLNYFAISLWGYVGAAVTALVTAGLITVGSWYAAAKYVHRIRILRNVFRPVIASLVMGCVLYLGARFTTVHVLLLVLSGIVVYFPVLFLVGGISRDDRDLFRQAINILSATR